MPSAGNACLEHKQHFLMGRAKTMAGPNGLSAKEGVGMYETIYLMSDEQLQTAKNGMDVNCPRCATCRTR